MATVRKIRGKWYLDYRDPRGRRHRELAGNGSSKRVANRILRRRLHQLESAGFRPEGARITFREYALDWLKTRRPELRHGTWVNYRAQVRNYLLHPIVGFGDLRLSAIGRREITQFRAALQESFPHLTNGTRNVALKILGNILQNALKDGFLVTNPARLVDKLPAPREEMDFMTPDEVRKLLEVAQGISWDLYAMIRLSVSTGIRRGELLALRWEHVDFEQARLYIRGSYRAGVFDEPKTGLALVS